MRSTGGAFRVHIDDFQFLIIARNGEITGPEFDNGLATFRPEEISDAVSITTGCHWGLVEVAVREEATVPAVEDGWQDIVEFSVGCASGFAVCELEGRQIAPLVEKGGSYRVRISASGRDAGRAVSYEKMTSPGWLEQPSGERYLIQVWPGPIEPPAVMRGAEDVPEPEGDADLPRSAVAAAGFAAAVELNSFIDRLPDGSQLADASEAGAERWYAATRRALFKYLAEPKRWMACSIPSMDENPEVGAHSVMYCMARADDDEHPIVGELEIDVRWDAITVNRTVGMTWTWCRPPGRDANGVAHWRTPILETVVHVELDDSTSADAVKGTRVRVRHGGFPDSLTKQVDAFWAWQLEYLESWL